MRHFPITPLLAHLCINVFKSFCYLAETSGRNPTWLAFIQMQNFIHLSLSDFIPRSTDDKFGSFVLMTIALMGELDAHLNPSRLC